MCVNPLAEQSSLSPSDTVFELQCSIRFSLHGESTGTAIFISNWVANFGCIEPSSRRQSTFVRSDRDAYRQPVIKLPNLGSQRQSFNLVSGSESSTVVCSGERVPVS